MAKEQASVKLLRKLAPRTILGEQPEKPEKAQPLFTIYGVAHAIKQGESAYGPWMGLVGDFEATRLSDKQAFRSPVAFLPEPFMSLTVAAIDKARRASKEGEDIGVEFACIVGIKPAKTNTGYEYTCEPLTEHRSSDRLSQMRAIAMAALPAPQKAA